MKKDIFITILICILMANVSCTNQKIVINREVETTSDGKMLLGYQAKDQFQKEPYNSWFTPEYNEYSLDENTMKELKKEKLNSYKIIVFLGTWCSDSHRNFPRLMKILDDIKFPENKLHILAVNRKKETPSGEEGIHNIKRVPTIIVYKYGKEVGRIIENPSTGYIEKDLLEIIKK